MLRLAVPSGTTANFTRRNTGWQIGINTIQPEQLVPKETASGAMVDDAESPRNRPQEIDVRRQLDGDLTDVDSLANRFQDPRYKKMTEDLGFSIFKEMKLKLGSTALDLAQKYERVKYEQHLDEQAPGVRAARFLTIVLS